MKIKYKPAHPGQIECTMEITMKLGGWKMIADSQIHSGPFYVLRNEIEKMIRKIEKHIESEEEFKEGE